MSSHTVPFKFVLMVVHHNTKHHALTYCERLMPTDVIKPQGCDTFAWTPSVAVKSIGARSSTCGIIHKGVRPHAILVDTRLFEDMQGTRLDVVERDRLKEWYFKALLRGNPGALIIPVDFSNPFYYY